MLEIKNCCKAFGDQTVLQDVSLNIHDGSIIGVSGASGIGKSTLAKILCGVTAPDAGEIFLDGQLLVSEKSNYDRRWGLAIQMVYQQPYATLDPSQKIGVGLRELISYHRLTKNRQETEKLIADILAQMQLPPKILAHLPRQISGGEAQRVALARCLLLRPKLLILDEATSMLDVSTQANLLALVKAQMIPSGGSVLFISHDRALTDFYCDTVYAFDEDHRLKEVRA
mgnify:FL=1